MGRRVSVRRLTEIVADRPVFRDVIGVLTSWDDLGLTVVPRSGAAVSFPAELLVAGRTVPLFPARRAPLPATGPAELELIAARGWPAVDTERLGEWTLRASAGFTRRANSVLAVGDPGLPLPEAVEAARHWYEQRGLPTWISLAEQAAPKGLAEELERHGGLHQETLLRTAPLAGLARIAGDHRRVRLSRTADTDWMSLYRRVTDDPAVEAAARRVIHGGPSVWFATVREEGGGAPIAIGRCVVDGAWAGFGAVEVSPAARRQGLASAMMAVLAARAAEEGATGAYLQVEADNGGALALYDRLGFTTSHTYQYVRLPQR
ncbi:GNAT family N-acetyltransferase [Kitasatospora sp. NPDC050543]|uniref:GNAT family N-acetyltransferase n=1 Tax=Kitasatospora sp. NPDC050543 TaxID=3364054 RepID=UPI0037B87E86